MRRPAIATILAILAASSSSSAPPRRPAMDRLPRVIVWAWERPENLRDLDRSVGVAFLAQTITIAGPEFHVTPRRQPLRVSAGTALVAVTRIEVSAAAIDSAPRPSTEDIVSPIADTATLPRVAAVQIDFDATVSERPFYRELLHRLRDRLPTAVPISITALASWCAGDNWLAGLPIDEAVPMLFRMGPANEPFLRMAVARAAAVPACHGTIGTSLDEPIDARADGRRIYIFNPRPWTEATMFQARRRAIE